MNKTIYYNPDITFPHLLWKLDVIIPRKNISQICEQLHFLVHERIGATFYYPDIDNDIIKCRFEWVRKYNNNKIGLRLGIYFNVDNNDLKDIYIYLTSNEVIYDNKTLLQNFSKRFQTIIKNEILQILNKAIYRLKDDALKTRYVILYIESHSAIESELETNDKKIKVFPSSLMQGKIVSPILISALAPSNQSARPIALREVTYFCALHTLANGQLCQTINVEWGKKVKSIIEFLDSPDIDNLNILYPVRHKPPIIFDNNVPRRIIMIWTLYNKLSNQDKDKFTKSLFAYYSAQSIMHKYSTLSIVAYISAMSCLTNTETCTGNLTCSKHGKLSFKHNIIGEKEAITNLVYKLFAIPKEQKTYIRELIGRIYHKHRSAFVHGAELRFGEFHSNYGMPNAFPTDKSIVKEEYYYRKDFMAFQLLARTTLIKWLYKNNEVEMDYELFNLDKLFLKNLKSFESSYVVPNIVVKPFHDGCPEK